MNKQAEEKELEVRLKCLDVLYSVLKARLADARGIVNFHESN